jgi:hypothetical protein
MHVKRSAKKTANTGRAGAQIHRGFADQITQMMGFIT